MFYVHAKQTFFTPGSEYELNLSSSLLALFHQPDMIFGDLRQLRKFELSRPPISKLSLLYIHDILVLLFILYTLSLGSGLQSTIVDCSQLSPAISFGCSNIWVLASSSCSCVSWLAAKPATATLDKHSWPTLAYLCLFGAGQSWPLSIFATIFPLQPWLMVLLRLRS